MKLPALPVTLSALERSASLSSSWADLSAATGAPIRRTSSRLAQRDAAAAEAEAVLVDRLERSGREMTSGAGEADAGGLRRMWRWLTTRGVS